MDNFRGCSIAVRETGNGKRRQQGRHSNQATVPAMHVLDMRYRSEVQRQTLRQVAAAYPQYTERYVRSVLEYATRANLLVKKPSRR